MAGGLLATQLSKKPLESVSGYDPEKIAVEAKDTAAGQLDTILDSGSKLMQSAETRGKQFANRRGVLNSTMAAQATQQAMIDSAAPIATHDASTNYDAKKSNQQAGNTALQFTAGQKNAAESQLADQGFRKDENALDRSLQTDLQSKDQQFQAGENALTREHQSKLQAGEQAWRSGEAGLDRAQQINVQNLEAQYNLLHQNDQQAFLTQQNALDRELEGMRLDANQKNAVMQSQMAAINAVLMDPNLEPAAKRVAIENIQANTRETAAYMESLNTSAARVQTAPAPTQADTMPALSSNAPVAQQVARGAINAIREREQATGTQGAEQRALTDMKAYLDAVGVDTSDPKAVAAALDITEAQAAKNIAKLPK